MAKSILSKEDAEKIVVSYHPRKFPLAVSQPASDFVALQKRQREDGFEQTFRIDRIVAEQTGIAELERLSIEEKVEQEALGRIKEVQEKAYEEAYQLGLDEGRERAFQERQSELDEKIAHLNSVVANVQNLKSDLITYNETHILSLTFFMARRLILDEVAARPELVLNIIKSAIENAQEEENITVRLSPSDYQFVEDTKSKLGKDYESLKGATFEASENITSGGCIIETNYGDVDATIEKRLEKLWDEVSEKLPRVKNVVGG